MSVGKIHLSLYEKYYIIAHNVCNGVHVYIRKKGKKSVSMKKLFEKWNSISLILRIVCGLVIGVILGLVVPQATGIAILGDVFVGALKAIAPLLVFFLLISALCHAGKSHGGIIKTVIIMYMFSTFLAALVAVIASRLFPVTLTLARRPRGGNDDCLHRYGSAGRYRGSTEDSVNEYGSQSGILSVKCQLYWCSDLGCDHRCRYESSQ